MSSAGSLRSGRFQFACYSADYLEAKAISDAVCVALEESELFDVVFNGDQDLQDPDTKLFYVVLDYSIWQDTV